jgi:hypothetical protein
MNARIPEQKKVPKSEESACTAHGTTSFARSGKIRIGRLCRPPAPPAVQVTRSSLRLYGFTRFCILPSIYQREFWNVYLVIFLAWSAGILCDILPTDQQIWSTVCSKRRRGCMRGSTRCTADTALHSSRLDYGRYLTIGYPGR